MTNNRNRRLDPAEVQAKQDRVFKRLKVTNDGSVEENPYLREYHETLTRLGEAKASSQDSFINWLTGLNAAAMSLALTGIEAAPYSIRVLQMFAALAFLLGVIAAIAFKAFLSVRYAHIEAEAEIRATQFYAHDAAASIQHELADRGVVSEEAQQAFLRLRDRQLDLIDPDKQDNFLHPVHLKEKLLQYSYRSCIGLFLMGLAVLAARYVVPLVLNSRQVLCI